MAGPSLGTLEAHRRTGTGLRASATADGGLLVAVGYAQPFTFAGQPLAAEGPAALLARHARHVVTVEIEPELTAKIFKRGYRVYEVPITYDGRGYEEGKKITWRDGVSALRCIIKYSLKN